VIDSKIIDDLAQKLSGMVPPGVQELQQDVEKNIRAVLQNTFAKLDLVTRDEFEVQNKVLLHSREKLEALEARVAELETSLLEKE
jgi:BMFP domain-containing protein YqiC